MLAQILPLFVIIASIAVEPSDEKIVADVTVAVPAPVSAPLSPEDGDTALIDPNDVPDNSDALSTDVDRWVLHDVLKDRFGQTDAWETTLQVQTEQARAQGVPDWHERLTTSRMQALLRGEPEQHHEVDLKRLHFDIPLMAHPLVDVYIDYFTGRGRWVFERWLNRAGAVVPLMQPILERHGVPKDLVYLAMIESGFSSHAYSSAAAAGYWQFMAPTGRLYGLRDDIFIDERRDFIRATEAAAAYLSSLKRQMGDWHLAWASYNAGEGRIRRALRETHTSTFWELIASKNNLAKETVHYVPKVIAAAIVAKDAERYGFRVTPAAPWVFDEITVKDSLDMAVLAKEMHVSPDLLRALNPALLHDITPPGRTMKVRVPQGLGNSAKVALAKLPQSKRLNFLAHKVTRGDTLSGIARRMGSSVDVLRQFNHLNAKTSLRVGQKLIVPAFQTTVAQAPLAPLKRRSAQPPRLATAKIPAGLSKASATRVRAQGPSAGRPKARHVVSYGDTLWSIARRYGVALSAIKGRSLHRNSNRLAVGDVLEIF